MDPLTLILLYVFGALFVAAIIPTIAPSRPLWNVQPAQVCGACRGRGFVYR